MFEMAQNTGNSSLEIHFLPDRCQKKSNVKRYFSLIFGLKSSAYIKPFHALNWKKMFAAG
jgi:hypothetical protein